MKNPFWQKREGGWFGRDRVSWWLGRAHQNLVRDESLFVVVPFNFLVAWTVRFWWWLRNGSVVDRVVIHDRSGLSLDKMLLFAMRAAGARAEGGLTRNVYAFEFADMIVQVEFLSDNVLGVQSYRGARYEKKKRGQLDD